MAETLILRRLLRSTTAILNQSRYYATETTTVEKQNRNLMEKGDKKEKGKWVTLPPFNPTINGSSIGEKISKGGRREVEEEGKSGVETTTSAFKWVVRCCPHLPVSLIHKLFRLRQVRRECLDAEGLHQGTTKDQELQLKRVGKKDLMNPGERVFLPISVEGSPLKKPEYQCNDQEKQFTRSLVLYKDPAIIAINKPPKLPVQGGLGIKKSVDELAAAYLRYDNKDHPRLVHRLDQDSSGILVMGRTQTSAAVLHSVFREKTAGAQDDEIDWKKRFLHKRYLALVFGVPKELSGTVSASLAKVVMDDGKSERITVADSEFPSQLALTEYKVIQTSNDGFSWLELSPLTGRKHQLRVHCAEVLGTPIVGDYKYGWQAHRRWKPLPYTKSSINDKPKSNYPGQDLECGSIAEKQPHLHLHCKQLILPDISVALENASHDLEYDITKSENLNLVAPLPFHMQRSWNILNELADQQGYS